MRKLKKILFVTYLSILVLDTSRALAAPQANLSASRLQGPAPLAVFFDATGTIDLNAQVDIFREYLYTFHFGDDKSGVWEYSGKSKGMQVGAPLAAHVFDKPGEYEVTLTVSDLLNNKDTVKVSISVVSPDAHYAGDKTVVLSRNSSTTNVPNDAKVITNVTSWPNWSSGIRYILMPNQDFSSLGNISVSQISDWQIISTSDSQKPTVANVLIEAGRPSTVNWAANGVIMNLHAADLDLSNSTENILVYNNIINNNIQNGATVDYWFLNSPLQAVRANLHWPKQTFIIENQMDLKKIAGMGYYGVGSKTVLMGNHIIDPKQHNIRLPLAYKVIIAHNKLVGAGATQHEIKVHSRGIVNSPTIYRIPRPRDRDISPSLTI